MFYGNSLCLGNLCQQHVEPCRSYNSWHEYCSVVHESARVKNTRYLVVHSLSYQSILLILQLSLSNIWLALIPVCFIFFHVLMHYVLTCLLKFHLKCYNLPTAQSSITSYCTLTIYLISSHPDQPISSTAQCYVSLYDLIEPCLVAQSFMLLKT